MTFSTNHPILFVLAGVLVAVVLAQSVYFLVKALARLHRIALSDGTMLRFPALSRPE